MKTADLITALAKDSRVEPGAIRRRLGVPLLSGLLVAAILVIVWLGRRSLADAIQTFPFWMKAAYTITLSTAGGLLVVRLSLPATRVGRAPWVILAIALTVMLALVAREFMATAPSDRLALWHGGSWTVCPLRILTISSPIYVGLLLGMRKLAPTRPMVAGAAAGFFAGALGATVYQLFCPETGAMFVATWYSLGILASTTAGALIGYRLMRW